MAGWGMSGRGQTLRKLRVEACGIVQMLLIAILLQLSFPVSASLADAAAPLSLDDSSICSSQAGHADPGTRTTVIHPGHCAFCLPLSAMAAMPVGELVLPVPHEVEQDSASLAATPTPASAVVLSGGARAPPILR